MKSFLKLLAVGVVALTVSETYAQTRDIGAQRILLDDGNGGVLTIRYQGPGDGEFIIPPGGGSATPNGTLTGQTLAWNNGMSQWQVMSNLLNTEGNVSMPSGNFSVAAGTISGISSTDGAGLSIQQMGAGNAGEFIVNNTAHSDYAVEALTNGQGSAGAFINTNSTNAGVALQGMTYGTSEAIGVWGWADEGIGGEFQGPVYGVNGISTSSGAGVHGISEEGNAGEFEIDNVTNNGNAVSGHTNGLGNAGEFIVDNTSHSDYAVEGLTNGQGSAGAFTNVNPTNETTALQGVNHGTTNAVGIWGWADEGTGGHFQGGSMGAKMQGPIAAQFTGSTTGILVAEGRFIGSTASVADGGTIADNVMIVSVTATGGGVDDDVLPVVSMPAAGTSGQILIVGTTDPDGATVNGITHLPNVAYVWTNINGTWMRTP